MCKHEEKSCPSCAAVFECKVGDVLKCECYGITLPAEAQAFVQAQYTDCLCRNCLQQLKNNFAVPE